ncbi:valine--tRNA ligase [Candidatus Micrarchaeota archaeon]|nr:valine--tRNA ligase [Candidatus Micrarchaeota archaeon]
MLDKYDAATIEKKWRETWEKNDAYKFRIQSKKPFYVIDTPPPFPTGEFHMGGVLNWCYMDFAARFKRMSGFEVLFPQGWDCHGFPTEVKVEKKYGKNLSKEEFRKKCLEWTHDVVGTMKPQMKQLGFSIDWSQEYYTIDPDYHRKVQYSLLKMFNQGDVYRAEHPVLFCTYCRSAIAKAEVDDLAQEGFLNDLKFEGVNGPNLTIATTRPELLHATVAVAVHPSDERYKNAVGKKVRVPIHDQEVPIISDVDVDKEFGSGAVMISTFGDKQDVVWAYRHKLPIVKAMDHAGRLQNAGAYDGLKATQAKEKILEDLKTAGLLLGQKKINQQVKIHDRCKKPIEFLSSTQWFIKLKGYENDVKHASAQMRWVPEHMRQLLLDWVEGLEWDWCISRQRVFGIPLPFWYCPDCGDVITPDEKTLPVDPSKDKAPRNCKQCGKEPVGETSICDGWVDSSITPLIISGWPDNENRFQKLYPVTVRPQGTDIIRTWAFYTTYRCLRLTGQAPFSDMLINGMVLGDDGKKMSKSLGNYVEAKDVIGKAGVDALRQWAALAGSTGKDNVFYWKDVTHAQSFLNKVWNASKFIQKAAGSHLKGTHQKHVTDHWIESRLQKTIRDTTNSLKNYQYYEALTALQSFFWHDVCDLYLEDVKHRVYGDDSPSKRAAQETLLEVLEATLKMLAPFSPFVTEELWHHLYGNDSIHSQKWPSFQEDLVNEQYESVANALHEALSQIRKFKAQNAMALNVELPSATIKASETLCKQMADVQDDLKAIAKIRALEFDVVQNAEKKDALEVTCTAPRT